MYSKPVSPLPIGAVLDDGFSLFRHSVGAAFPFAFAAAFAPAALGHVLTDRLVADGGELSWLAAAGALLVSVASMPLFVPALARIRAVRNGDSLSASEALRLGIQRFFPVLGVAAVYVAMLVAGAFLFVVPAVYALVTFAFSLLVAAVERKGVVDSLRASFDVVRGRWWRTAVSLTVGTVVLNILLGLVFATVLAFHRDAVIADGQVRLPWHVDLIVLPAAAGVLMPLFYALLIAIHAEAKLRREGTDIAARLAAAEA